MDDAAVDSHAAEAGGLSNPLVRDDPAPFRKPLHFHRERHRRIERTDAEALESAYDACGDFVDLVALAMKFMVGDGTRGRADRGSRWVRPTMDKSVRVVGNARAM